MAEGSRDRQPVQDFRIKDDLSQPLNDVGIWNCQKDLQGCIHSVAVCKYRMINIIRIYYMYIICIFNI